MSGRGTDFFISHAGRDTSWAEWLAWQLEQAGWTVELDVWDWAPGEDFVARMAAALERADRLHGHGVEHRCDQAAARPGGGRGDPEPPSPPRSPTACVIGRSGCWRWSCPSS